MGVRTRQHRTLGMIASWSVAVLLALYLVTLVLGFLSLAAPDDPIGDPYFTLLEALILLTAPLMVLSMIAVHGSSPTEARVYGLAALVFMAITATITSGVHFVVLTVSRQAEGLGLTGAPVLFAFRWPSVAYALDILAWDWFFALAMIFGALAFNGGRLERATRVMMLVSGVVSLAGLIGVAMGDMNVRNIGILGYTVVAIPAFVLIGMVVRRGAGGEPCPPN